MVYRQSTHQCVRQVPRPHAVAQHGFFGGQRRRRPAHGFHPVRRHFHRLGAPLQAHALRRQAHLHVQVAIRVVVHHGAQGRLISDHQEAWRHRPNHHLQRRHNVRHALAHLRLGRHPHTRHAPGGQVIGQCHFHLGLARRVGAHGRAPIGRIGEHLARRPQGCLRSAAAFARLGLFQDAPVHRHHHRG